MSTEPTLLAVSFEESLMAQELLLNRPDISRMARNPIGKLGQLCIG